MVWKLRRKFHVVRTVPSIVMEGLCVCVAIGALDVSVPIVVISLDGATRIKSFTKNLSTTNPKKTQKRALWSLRTECNYLNWNKLGCFAVWSNWTNSQMRPQILNHIILARFPKCNRDDKKYLIWAPSIIFVRILITKLKCKVVPNRWDTLGFLGVDIEKH